MPTETENHGGGVERYYPNSQSYAMSGASGRGQPGNNKLQRAVLYSAKKTTSEEEGGGGIFGPSPGSAPYLRRASTEIITTLKKPFQFNPPSLLLQLAVAPSDPEAAILAGGTEAGGSLGSATTSVEMLFERSMEVHAGIGEYKRLGVAKDYLDVIAVLRGDPTLLDASSDKTIREFTHSMTDLVGNGSEILMTHRAAIVYSEDLVVFGLITNIRLRFLQFSRDLIPTMGYIDLEFEIHNATNRTGVTSQAVSAGVGTATTGTSLVNANLNRVVSGWSDAIADRRDGPR